MKYFSFILKLIIILNVNSYAFDNMPFYHDGLYQLKISKFKIIKTQFTNFKNKVKVTTLENYDNIGRIQYFKYEISDGKTKYIDESKNYYNQNSISIISFENNVKIEERIVTLNSKGCFQEIKTTYQKDKDKYNTINFKYYNKNLISISYKNRNDDKIGLIEEFSYNKFNKINKVIRKGINFDDEFSYEYNNQNKIIKEVFISKKNSKIINYHYNDNQFLSSKVFEFSFYDKENINGKSEYFYDKDGNIIKEIGYVSDNKEYEKLFFYE